MITKKCGDCIHAEICKQLNGGWFSAENIAYCKAFKDHANYVEVVRCKDCKHYMTIHCTCDGCCISDDWYCADGEKMDGDGNG